MSAENEALAVGHHSLAGRQDEGVYLFGCEVLDRIAGSHLVAIRSKLSVEARRTRGAVEDLASEVACRRGDPGVFVLRWPRGTTS